MDALACSGFLWQILRNSHVLDPETALGKGQMASIPHYEFYTHGSLRDSFSDFECTGMGHTILDSPRHMEFIPVLSEFIQFRPFK